jgi:hypothetical protein
MEWAAATVPQWTRRARVRIPRRPVDLRESSFLSLLLFFTGPCTTRNNSEADELLVRDGKCTRESLLLGMASRARRRVLVQVAPTRGREVLVRGGNSEGVLGGTPRRVFSCEAETPRKGFSEELVGGSSRARRKEVMRKSLLRETLRGWKNKSYEWDSHSGTPPF